MSKKRGFSVTLCNYTEEEYQILTTVSPQVKYCIIGKEIAPTTGMKHLQMYFQFVNAKTLLQAIAYFPKRSHIEVIKGSPNENIIYCSKEKDFYEYGDRPNPGRRTDIEEVNNELIDCQDQFGLHHT